MQYQTVSMTYTRKLNVGNYESVESSCYLSAKVDEGDRLKDVLESLSYSVKNSVYKALESEMSDEIKVQLKKRICGKEISESEFVVVSNKEVESTLAKSKGGNNSVISKFASLLDTGDEVLIAELEEHYYEDDYNDDVPF